MTIVLCTSNNQRLAQWTGVFAGILVATYITLEAPFSGMNPARTLSALPAQVWTVWIYCPHSWNAAGSSLPVGVKPKSVAKLNHQNNKRCIFHCGYREQERRRCRTFSLTKIK